MRVSRRKIGGRATDGATQEGRVSRLPHQRGRTWVVAVAGLALFGVPFVFDRFGLVAATGVGAVVVAVALVVLTRQVGHLITTTRRRV